MPTRTVDGKDRRHPEAVSRAAPFWRFGEFTLNVATSELHRAGAALAVSSQSLSLLCHVVRHRDRVVSREELGALLWPDIVVSDGSLRQAVWELRRAIGDDGGGQRLIKTVRGRGYRFLAEVTEEGAARELPSVVLQTSDFFGRAQELARLEQVLEAATAEAGRSCVLSGAPGIGKSRLARELIRVARGRGFVVVEGRADPQPVAPPFWPWLQMLSTYLARVEPVQHARYERLAPNALRLLTAQGEAQPRLEQELSDSFKQRHFQLLEELAALFTAMTNARPGVLFFDDLQWADDASLAFLRHFAGTLPQTRALLLISCQDGPRKTNRKLGRSLEALARGPFHHELELKNLHVDEVARMLLFRTGRAVDSSLAADVHALSHGNPLFALELAYVLTSDRDAGLAELPPGHVQVESVIRRRFSSLPEASMRAVFAASVLSSNLSLAELAGILEQSPEVTLESLEPCLVQGVLLEPEPAHYRFAHPLMRAVAYDCLTRIERCRLHGLAGAWIERQGPDRVVARLNELANHFFLAAPQGTARKALDYQVRCAKRAYAAAAYSSAVAHYARALQCSELLDTPDATVRLELELARGEALRASDANANEVNALFVSLSERASALGDAGLFARAVLGYTGQRAARFTPTRFAATVDRGEIALLERALAWLPEQASELRVLVLCSLVYALMCTTHRARRERLADQALDLARVLDVPWLIARVLTLRSFALAAPDQHDQRAATCRELFAFAEATGLKEQEVDARIGLAIYMLGIGDRAGAEREGARARQLAEELGTRRAKARAEVVELLLAFCEGELELAERLCQEALDAALGDLGERALFVVRMAALRMLRAGAIPELVALHESTVAAYPDAVGLRCGLASAHATLGNQEQARRHFDHVARDAFKHLPEDVNWLPSMELLADAACHLDDSERARQVYDRLVPHAHLFAFFAGAGCPAGPVAHWLGELATTMGEYDLAGAWLAKADALNRRLGARLFAQYGALAKVRLWSRSRCGDARIGPTIESVYAFCDAKGTKWLRTCATELASGLDSAAASGGKRAVRIPRSDSTGPRGARVRLLPSAAPASLLRRT